MSKSIAAEVIATRILEIRGKKVMLGRKRPDPGQKGFL
jgi:hypothetical protein